MSVQTLGSDELPDSAAEVDTAQFDTAPRALRVVAVAAVCLGVAALAAATFVLSYSGIRAVALQAGITPRLAKGYPLLLDAMLVIVLAAVLALRGAGLPSRLLAWLTLLLVMAAAAGADALHTAGRSLPHQAAAITAAVLPWVLVLIAFTLLLVMLRHARLRGLASATDRAPPTSAWAIAQSGGFEAPPPDLAQREPGPDTEPPDADDGAADEGVGEPAAGTSPYPVESLTTEYYGDADDMAVAAEGTDGTADSGPALTAEASEPDDPDGPVFHRLFSAPTPPAEV
jgi:Protein of unknown function (DUF2637)